MKEINYLIKTMVLNAQKASTIHSYLIRAYGTDVMTLRQVQRIAREYKNQERSSTSRKSGSGRPITSTINANVERIKLLIEEDTSLSTVALSTLTDIPRRTIHRILTVNLKKKCLRCRWVPHELSALNKLNRKNEAARLIQVFSRRIGSRMIVIDEKWIYCKDTPPIFTVLW